MLSLRVFKLIFLLLIIGCSTSKDDNCPTYALTNSYSNKELDFSIDLPGDYIVDKSSDVLALSSVKPASDKNYIESCGVRVHQNNLNFKLEEFYQLALLADEKDYGEIHDNYQVHKKGDRIINSNDSRWAIYSYDDEKVLSYFFVYRQNMYRVMFLSKKEHFDSLECKYKQIINSIDFLQ
ncbi:MAG: hypothetical protein RIA62_06450 [Cyclobacteriaceae bacterium]